MMLTDTDCRRIAHYLYLEIENGGLLKPQKTEQRTLVGATRAAQILGISRSQLYRIADQLTHIKGNNNRLVFDADKIVKDYEKLLLQ